MGHWGVLSTLAAIASLALPLTLLAADAAPSPHDRYDAARQAMQQGRYAEAEAGFRAVAEAESAPEALRVQALFSAGLMQQSQRHYEQALATFREIEQRFPTTPLARRAADAAATLTEGGGDAGIAFQRRFDEMMDAYTRARDSLDRNGAWAARSTLATALALADGLLRDFPDHPRLKVVAFQAGEIAVASRRFADAQALYRRALAIAGTTQEPDAPHDTFVDNAEKQLIEAGRLQRRWWSTFAASAILAAIGVGFVFQQPWTVVDRELLRTVAVSAAAVAGWSLVAEGVSWFVRTYIDDHSPVTAGIAVVLVALPGLAGSTIGLGFLAAWRRKAGRYDPWPGWTAASLGALAGFAAAVCVVNFYDLFQFLDSML